MTLDLDVAVAIDLSIVLAIDLAIALVIVNTTIVDLAITFSITSTFCCHRY